MESQSIGAVGATMSATTPAPAGPADRARPAAPTVRPSHDEKNAADAHEAQTHGSTEIPQRDPRSLHFQVDGSRVITTIIDENNKTVVLQIPDAEVIRIAKSIDRMQGFLLEQKG